MGYSIGLNEFKTPVKLIKSLVAELIGTMFLVMIGCGSAIAGGNNFTGVRDIYIYKTSYLLQISPTFLSFSSAVIILTDANYGDIRLLLYFYHSYLMFSFESERIYNLSIKFRVVFVFCY